MNQKDEDRDLIEEPGQGHNSFSKIELEKVCAAIEEVNEQIDSLRQDIKAAMEVAVQKGLDKRTIREALRQRALDPQVREERESLRDLYLGALGLL